jgi:signal transduction histidine kinase
MGEQLDVEIERETVTGTRTFLLRNVPLSAGETRAGYAIYTDISEQKHYQTTLAALQRTTRQLISAETEHAIGRQLIETAQQVLSLPYAVVLRHRHGENVLRPVAVPERWGSLDSDLVEYLTFEAGGSLTWTAFENGEAAIYEDITTEPDVGRSKPNVRGTMVLPIGEWGVFLIGSKTANAFDETDLDFARVLAASAEAAFERTARETTIRKREAQLARQNRRLEQFASVVSHDLRNPLTIARGRLDLAIDENTGQLERIDDALERIESIIDDVLQLAREDTVEERECVDLAACAREAWALVETDGGRLSIEENGTVRADRSRLQRVFENLFRNAVEHGSTDEEGMTVRVGPFEGGFFVADDGEGIPLDEREAVFTYGHSGGDGSGLGLAIVAQIVEAHGWRVSITDSVAGGARFEIRTEPSD